MSTFERNREKATLPQCPVDHARRGKELVNIHVACNVDYLFNVLFTESEFFKKFLHQREASEIKCSTWQKYTSSQKREVSYKCKNEDSLNETCTITETQSLLYSSRPGALYGVDTKCIRKLPENQDFRVDFHFCLQSVSQKGTNLTVIIGPTTEETDVGYWTKYFDQLKSALGDEFKRSDLIEELKAENNGNDDIINNGNWNESDTKFKGNERMSIIITGPLVATTIQKRKTDDDDDESRAAYEETQSFLTLSIRDDSRSPECKKVQPSPQSQGLCANRKIFVTVIIAILILVITGVSGYLYFKSK